jgi:hypothetical protein
VSARARVLEGCGVILVSVVVVVVVVRLLFLVFRLSLCCSIVFYICCVGVSGFIVVLFVGRCLGRCS